MNFLTPSMTRSLLRVVSNRGLRALAAALPLLAAAGATANDKLCNSSGNCVGSNVPPARGHYARLAMLDPNPAKPGLAIDAQVYPSTLAQIERVKQSKPEFLRVPLEDFDLPPMPANSSAQTRAEIDYLLRIQAQRSEAEGQRALSFANWSFSAELPESDPKQEANRANLFLVGRSVGTWFNAKRLPRTTALLARAWRDLSYHMWSMKFKYARVRPHVIDPSLKAMQNTAWAAFPSGHSTNAHFLAYFYGELAPEFADVFLKDAADIGHSREIIGVHFPSDTESGRVLARQLLAKLLANEAFAAEFAKVREEWKEVRQASAD
jgi:acid phosphatase (class A)